MVKEDQVGFIIGKSGSFTKFLKDEHGVQMQAYKEKHNRGIYEDEKVIVSSRHN